MPATCTITGTAGPAKSLTAQVFTGVDSIFLDANGNLITLYQSGATVGPLSVAAATTVTATKSGNTWTLVIS